jgi:filamentous hemagglutinin
MPVYDKYAAYDTKISFDVAMVQRREKHFKEATLDLKRSIESGEVPRSRFNEEQLAEIMKGNPKIPDYTWHHHEDVGRMQLIPEVLHKESAHIGGMGLWYQKFSEGAK